MLVQDNNLKILIIDDNPDIHQDFIKILAEPKNNEELEALENTIFSEKENKGSKRINLPNFQIDTVLQGKDGFEKIKKALDEGKPYSLAFVDIRMPPGWDGITTIKHIWEVDSSIQIVICTAYSDYSWEETVEKLGQTDNLLILKKPFDHTAVRQLTFALTKKWQLSQENKRNTELLKIRIKERTLALEMALTEINTTLEAASDGILIINFENEVVIYNRALVHQWHLPDSILEAKVAAEFMEYILSRIIQSEEFYKKLNHFIEQKTKISIDVLKANDGKVFECYSQPFIVAEKAAGRVFSFRDITQQVILEEQLKFQATHDALTNLPNRILLQDRLQQLKFRAERDKTSFAILFLDLDRFKLINDSYDHSFGDELLKLVAERLTTNIRKMDTIARIGGDEFVIVFPNIPFEEAVVTLANKLLLTLRETYSIDHRNISCSFSVGVCVYPKDGITVEELIRNADLAMYRAKELGGDQFQFYSPVLNERNLHRVEIENQMRKAITNNEFLLNYQPEFDAETGKIIAAEALIRWNHPIKGMIPPLDFIPYAEETDFIVQLGEWVLKTACEQNLIWQNEGFKDLQIAVNVSKAQLKFQNFSNTVSNILKETGLKPEHLIIEITENTITNNQNAVDAMYDLKKLGVKLALDDFGTGVSSLNYLRTIPIDHVKIDKSFVKNINVNRSDEILIRSIIQMAENLNLKITAEGVETKSQVEFLLKNKAIELQGYYFSKPLEAGEFGKFLKDYKPIKPG